jgi:hypothetical protein
MRSETEFLRHLPHLVIQIHGRRQAGNRRHQFRRRLAAILGRCQKGRQRIAVVGRTVLGAVELALEVAGGRGQVKRPRSQLMVTLGASSLSMDGSRTCFCAWYSGRSD